MTDSDLYAQVLSTAAGCGLDVISRNHAAQLIAAVYLYGDESAVFSSRMNADIRYIQRKYHILGGCVPDGEFIGMVKHYAADIRQNKHPSWLAELERRYGVTFPEYQEYKPPEWRK